MREKAELPYFEQPETENERLFNLQKNYKENQPGAIIELYKKLCEVAYKMINKISNSDPKVKALDAEEREQKANDAAVYIIEQYIKRPDFIISDSMTEYLKRRVLKELYYARNCDKMLVFSDSLPEVASMRQNYRFIVTNVKTAASVTYENLQELRLRFPKIRLDQIRQCIDAGKTYKNYSITMLEIEG